MVLKSDHQNAQSLDYTLKKSVNPRECGGARSDTYRYMISMATDPHRPQFASWELPACTNCLMLS